MATVFEQSTFMCFLFTKALAETCTERYTTIIIDARCVILFKERGEKR